VHSVLSSVSRGLYLLRKAATSRSKNSARARTGRGALLGPTPPQTWKPSVSVVGELGGRARTERPRRTRLTLATALKRRAPNPRADRAEPGMARHGMRFRRAAERDSHPPRGRASGRCRKRPERPRGLIADVRPGSAGVQKRAARLPPPSIC